MVVEEDTPLSYEESRKQRVKENMKRMEELGLMALSKSLKTKKAPKRNMPSLEQFSLDSRRSSRVAAKPAVSYVEKFERIAGLRERVPRRQGLSGHYLSDKARMRAIDEAEKVLEKLKNPGFVKPMLHSHTASGFWLGIPLHFCRNYLPTEDERLMLEDADDREWECIYLGNKGGLSGGWRGFSLDHDLVDGDCVIFELVSRLRLKVHIFRAHNLEGEEAGQGKVKASEVATKGKKAIKAKASTKAAASAPAKLGKPKKLSAIAPKKLDLDEDEGGDTTKPLQKDSKQVNKEAAGLSRSAKRRHTTEEDDVSEVGDILELDSEGYDDKDAYKPSAAGKLHQASSGCRSSGRSTRKSTVRSLPPSTVMLKSQ